MALPPQDSELESLLHRAWETGRRPWPQVDLPADVFIRHLARLLPKARAESPLAPLVEKLDLEGLYLACACVNEVPVAVKMLELHYMAKLPGLLGYLKLPTATLDEVCQLVRTHLLVRTPEGGPRLAEYTGRGALLIWMRVIAVRLALRQGASVREVPDEHALEAIVDLPALGMDAELAHLRRRHLPEAYQAMRDAIAALSRDQRYLLRLHYKDQLPTTRIGPMYGKDQSTISRWLKEARENVHQGLKRRLQERLRLTTQEFESLMEAIQSGFDVNLSQLLDEQDEVEGGQKD